MGDRFLEALTLILFEETGYRQPVGGPYVRLVVTKAYNAKRAKRGLPAMPLGPYVLDEASSRLRTPDAMATASSAGAVSAGARLRGPDGGLHALPDVPDGMAFDDHPRDTGGRTGMGILQREYDPWRRRAGLAVRDVWAIGDRELEDIYRRQYWDAARCSELEPGTAEFTFNINVNCGVGIGVRFLQMAADAKVDGHIGVATIEAANAKPAAEVVAIMADRARRRYRSLKGFDDFGANWIARTDRMEVYCRAHAEDLPLGSHVVAEAIAEVGAPEQRTARAQEEPPKTLADSTTASAAAYTRTAAKVPVFVSIIGRAHEFVAAGKSLLSLEFALAVMASPEFWLTVAAAATISTAMRHAISERANKILHMGV